MFGFQRRRVRRWEWEMELPKPGPLPQISQVAATGDTPKQKVGGIKRPGRPGDRLRVPERPPLAQNVGPGAASGRLWTEPD